ncbi:hypothetical protein EDB89DRAFT_1977439 [Lactarius sanguifluus]|nr:hypothetical protein EDB89DRAFT_1977439 [Lactarius sanguifluus]
MAWGSAIAFADISDHLISSTCFCIQSMMGGGIIIWRMYITYDNVCFKVIIPAIIVIAYSGRALVLTFPCGDNLDHGVFRSESLTMTTNVLLSGAIALQVFLARNPV